MKQSILVALALTLAACATPEETPAPEPAPEAAAAPVATGPLNANLATEAELAAHESVGADVAAAIVAGRPYANALALNEVVGSLAGADGLDAVYAAVWMPLNLNHASREEILLVPGVGDRMAHEFEEYRPYVAMAQFKREMAKYVDDTEVERLAAFVFVPIDLNTASDEDILAIPGIGNRMLREFKEYRPYTDMAQFRREMGKYVDEVEVARMERYVEIRTDN